ncbi:hypothetical protein BE08_33025 [Sorangium cellulosum]|uniref:site-specific DNA-methyltransferase (adenine-specific) n=1 Tax=Sorangium cellulosum TaxID=56 RepID=A0A150P288_SORCE|nr:hypothetical protein BE08_33025 [Sorangium cellulosum]
MLAFHAVHTEGGLLPQDILQRVALEDKTLAGLSPEAYHLDPGERIRDAVNRAWSRLTVAWRGFQTALAKLPEGDPATTVTRERWLLPLFEVLGYGRLVAKGSALDIGGKSYAISHVWNNSPIHLLGCRVDLDTKQKGVAGAAAASPHGIVQDLLNRSDGHLWGVVSNGHVLRLLRDHHSLTQQAYVEFDLQAIFDGEAFSEFLLLWLVCHQSRVEAEKPAECWLERWFQTARDEGVRALDRLRAGVIGAIEALGTGFLRHRANKGLHAALEKSQLDKQDYYRQLLRLVYRLIFLFVAEDRGALLDPRASEPARARYERFYTTRRLRELAGKRRGGPHGDLWQQLRLIMGALEGGSPELGLPALGSFLWRREATHDLNALELANEDLLAALKALCYVEQGRARHAVSWRNIGAEELGSVYESLLELHPDIHKEAARFELSTAAGHERKTTGSYYTPTSLVDCLLDSALDPVLDEAASKPDPEKAILDLKVCDPACGSGHFLVAAARRIAMRLATVRSGGEEPSPPEVQRALRDVVGRCIYGVDLNPMAVELCKVSLWMEAIEPGKPLSFLESHIQQGNALLGATPALMAKGIPDEAFEPIEGDDKEVAKRLKKRNREARKGQGTLFADFAKGPPASTYARITTAVGLVEADRDDDIAGLRKKEEDWEQLTASEDFRKAMFLADAWCAAFVWPKQKGVLEDGAITEDLWRRMEKDISVVPAATRREVSRIAREYSFFHWHLAFAQVFFAPDNTERTKDETAGWSGGFDVMLGNPPWDTLSPDAKEFFSAFDPSIRTQDRDGQAELIEKLLLDESVAAAWGRTRRHLFHSARFFKISGRFTLFAPGNLGKGDFNIFRMFVELALRLVRLGGYSSQIVPDGLYNGANSTSLRKALFDEYGLLTLLAFENQSGAWFPGVHRSQKFCIYSSRRGTEVRYFRAAFGLRTLSQLAEAVRANLLEVPVDTVHNFSPDTLAFAEFQGQRDIDLATKMYSIWPKFGDSSAGPPYREYLYEIDLADDRGLLSEDRAGLPLYEGRMVGQYDHRAKGYRSGRGRSAEWEEFAFGDSQKAICPQWYIPRNKVPKKSVGRSLIYRFGFCDVASPSNERSFVAALLPPGCLAGHTVPTIYFGDGFDWYSAICLAVANSFCMDYLVRQKINLHVTFLVFDSLPFPRLSLESPIVGKLVLLVLRLICTASEMIDFWNSMEKHGWVTAVPRGGSPPGIVDEEQRLRVVAEVEAVVAYDLYRLDRDELAYVMDAFPIVERRDVQKYGRYRTKELVLEAYDARVSADSVQS